MSPEPKSGRQIAERIAWVQRQVRRLVVGDERDDVSQEALARMLTAKRLTNSDTPAAYVAQVARNIGVDQFRKTRARGGRPISLDNLDDVSLPHVAPDQDSALTLKQIILALPPIYRDTLVLNRFVGLTYAEIAARYGITVKAVEYRMSRAIALCAEALRN